MDVIDVNKERLQEVDVKGHMALFTELRVDKSAIPEGVYCYELRHGDDDSYPAALEKGVRVNYFGAILMTDKIELGKEGYIPLEYEDFGFSGEDLSVAEYLANYGEEPDDLSSVSDLVSFAENELKFPMTEKEADILLGYMEGHEFLLGKKEGKLFRGDLCYAQEIIRWTESSIDDVINFVMEMNSDMIAPAEVEMEFAENSSDFLKKKDYYDRLCEDEKTLDILFSRTRYGKELNELAVKKGLLPEVSWELKQGKGKAR